MYKALREFARGNGWDFHLGPMGYPYISGKYRGHQFNFDFGSYHFRLLRMPRFRMLLTIPIDNPTGVDFILRGRFLLGFVNLIRPWGLQIGEKSFDQQFVLTGKPENLVIKLFADNKLWQGLQGVQRSIGGISVQLNGQGLICEPQVFSFSVGKAMSIIEVGCDLADAVNEIKESKDGD